MGDNSTFDQMVISFSWRRNDGKEISINLKHKLQELATNKIVDMIKEDYREGELSEEVYHADYGMDGHEYIDCKGWWRVGSSY
jgi:hypothetical protein